MFLIVLTAHVLTLCVFVGTAVMIDLRLLGLTMLRRASIGGCPTACPLGRRGGFLVMVVSQDCYFSMRPQWTGTKISSFGPRWRCWCSPAINVWVFHKKVVSQHRRMGSGAGPPTGGPAGRRFGFGVVGWPYPGGAHDSLPTLLVWLVPLLEFFEWLQYSSLLVAMRSSPWLFPIIASMHLLGLALLGGAVLVVDLRLLGLGLSRQPVARLARDAERWLLASLAVMLPTGTLLFMCFATKYYYLTAFWVKVISLFAGARVYLLRPSPSDHGRTVEDQRDPEQADRPGFALAVDRRGFGRTIDRVSVTGFIDGGQMRTVPDGLIAVVRRDCPTCALVEPVLQRIGSSAGSLTVYSQDDVRFPEEVANVIDDTDLEHSHRLQIETVPTLLQFENGGEVGRAVGWHRGEWEALSGIRGLGADLPETQAGCGSKSVEPGVAEALAVRFGNASLAARRVEVGSLEDETEACFERGWTDGLPVVPPTEVRVLRMLEGTRRCAQ